MDYVAFTCPVGYVFEGTNNITHFALCYNWEFIYLFDPEVLCVRKLPYMGLGMKLARIYF
jgi:hypothetical protein